MAKDTQVNGQGATEKQPTTVQEAGRKGGRRVKEKYGQAFYVEIGKKGGRMIAESRGSEYYAEIGKKGGETVRERHGSEFFATIGKKGGDEVKRRHGPEYYSTIGKKGGEAPRRTDKRRTPVTPPPRPFEPASRYPTRADRNVRPTMTRRTGISAPRRGTRRTGMSALR